MNTSLKTTLAAAALVAALTGCTTGGTAADPQEGTQEGTQPATASTPAAPAAEETPETSGTAAFGEEWIYEDGLTVKVDYAGAAQASNTAAGAESTMGQMRLFDVSVTNWTDAPFDPVLLMVDANFGPAGTAAQTVFDSAAGIGDHFQGVILPGNTQTVRMAYAIPTDGPQDVQFVIAPDFVHDEAIFYAVALAP